MQTKILLAALSLASLALAGPAMGLGVGPVSVKTCAVGGIATAGDLAAAGFCCERSASNPSFLYCYEPLEVHPENVTVRQCDIGGSAHAGNVASAGFCCEYDDWVRAYRCERAFVESALLPPLE
ncbi:MAG TPA: hypothetical protein VM681_07500 [Candidatus Thermoplasmatota archaeon]|nr:hypothetical protein [Candidatus Thermoplasmatota archaeon]